MAVLGKLSIRRSRPGDAPILMAILYDTFESTWRPNISAQAAEAYRKADRPADYVNKRGQEFWVVERDSELIGFVDWQEDFVNALHVRTRFARSGAGTCLMDKAEAEIARQGFISARLETDTFNTASQSFYAKRGYEERERYRDLEWNSGLTTILLVKRLG